MISVSGGHGDINDVNRDLYQAEYQHQVNVCNGPDDCRAATVSAADLLGRSDQIGTLEPGTFADIIAVSASPLDDVRRLETVDFVMRHGVVEKLGGERQALP